MKQTKPLISRRGPALLLAVSMALSVLSGCSKEMQAATMHLMRTKGDVYVSDDAGKDVALLENLGLYSGYGVDTQSESYAWVNLDSVKLTKMDENSEIEIQKEGTMLEIEVKSGALLFNVTEPLADDETMNIRTLTMIVGIRGACGWVETPDGEHMNLYLLEGKVECTAGKQTSQVKAGEMAAMTESGQIEVQPFSARDIPAFVLEEIEDDDDLVEAILDESGLDVLNPEPEELADPVELALEQYRIIVSQADSYDYGSYQPVIGYRCALVRLQPEDEVPTLLLEQETEDYLQYALVFQYDPETGAVHQPAESLMEGVAPVGGYRGSLAMMSDGNGIHVFEMSSGTGSTYITRVTLAGDSLVQETVWTGFIEQVPDAISTAIEIDWHDISDASALDSWTPDAAVPTPQPDTAPPAGPDGGVLPTDGDRIVFRGTLRSYSYDEVVALQGEPDPNAGWSDAGAVYWLAVLDEPQTMTLRTGDGLGYRDGTTDMINVTYAAGLDELKQYDGQRLIFSVDPETTWWPSDTSLPLGRPSTSDIRVLQ